MEVSGKWEGVGGASTTGSDALRVIFIFVSY